MISPINTDSIRFNIQVMIATLSVIIITLLLLLPLCACKKKAKFGKFIDDPKVFFFFNWKIVPQSRNISEKEIQQMKLENTQSTIILNESPEKMPQKQIEVVAEIQKQTPNLEITKSNQTQTAEETQCSQTYVQPRVRFFKRAKEIEQCEPIDKQRHEYRTLMLIDEDKNLITENIHPREVRQQDIIECKIEKYTIVGYQMPEILEEYTCRDDDF
ncbi:unnamed protein product [Brugia timori]|uniref:Uncharacterized protein n=1 Tax=Brugia timori TaxID=42155 RepID=A0A3P7VCJ3_9BILA|nr:unnamed protein product [Brugia timori]